MIIKTANRLTKIFHILSPEAKKVVGKAGMLRSKKTYLTGLIKGNQNIKKDVEDKIKQKISYTDHKNGYFSHVNKPVINVDPSNHLEELIIKKKNHGSNKDLYINNALSHRHELREQLYGKVLPGNGTLGYSYNKNNELVGTHSSAAVVLKEIVDALRVPSIGAKDLIDFRIAHNEHKPLTRILQKPIINFKHSDSKKIISHEVKRFKKNPNASWAAYE